MSQPEDDRNGLVESRDMAAVMLIKRLAGARRTPDTATEAAMVGFIMFDGTTCTAMITCVLTSGSGCGGLLPVMIVDTTRDGNGAYRKIYNLPGYQPVTLGLKHEEIMANATKKITPLLRHLSISSCYQMAIDSTCYAVASAPQGALMPSSFSCIPDPVIPR